MEPFVVTTSLLFIDTSRSLLPESQGDNHITNLNNAGVICGQGQYLRFTLDNFSMAKVFPDVNDNNNSFNVRANGFTPQIDCKLTNQNYASIADLGFDFATQLGIAFTAMVVGGQPTVAGVIITSLSPAQGTTTPMGTTNNIITFTLTFKDASNAPLTNYLNGAFPIVQFLSSVSDSYALLGGDRITDSTNTVQSSITITTDATSIYVKCLYPAQRSTTPYVYLRANLSNTNQETLGLAQPTDILRSDTTASDILGRIVVDTEWCQYTTQSGHEFFINLFQKNCTNLELRLTDSHNRPLGRRSTSTNQTATHQYTASGTGEKQSLLGNLFFSAVIRVDVIQQQLPNELNTKPFVPNYPARFNNLRTNINFD
jgi:hypothetical protein